MSYLTERNKQYYHDIKSGKRKQFANRDSRQEIDKYKKGFADGFSRGYASAVKNNWKIIKEMFGS